MELSIVIPIYNEEENIPLIYNKLLEVMDKLFENGTASFELIFINDGSIDRSLPLLKDIAANDKRVGYINFSRNFGHQIAVSAGIDYAKGNAIVIIDADLQDPPELIIDLYNKWKEGFEVVYAQRIARKGEGVFKKMTAKLFYKIIEKITSINIPVDTGDFRLIDRKIVEVLKDMPEKNKFLRGQIAWAGFNQVGIPYERDARHGGETGYTFRKMLRLALDGITAFSDFPLKIATMVGFTAFLFSLGLIVYALWSNSTGGTVPGWTSLTIIVSFIGGVQLLCIGLIGEYIIRLINNIRNRPLYIIESSNLLPEHSKNK
ncbi:MAG: glycosyltransferase family 2 protein [Chitinophagales bacterium]